MFQKNFYRKSKQFFFRKSCCLLDNVKKYCTARRPQLTIRRFCIAYWLHEAKSANKEYLVFMAYPIQKRIHESDSKLRQTSIGSVDVSCIKTNKVAINGTSKNLIFALRLSNRLSP
jgi:hypothetical protein